MTLLVSDELYVKHDHPGHPECAGRVEAINSHLRSCGLLDELTTLPARDATEEELASVHLPAHVSLMGDYGRRAPSWVDPDTYMGTLSLDAAKRAAGGVIEAVNAVVNGKDRTAFCLVRPPGHHATPGRAMGFCIFNNVAVATRISGKRTLIVDWDVHHGNGTQDIFHDDPGVFYFSTHLFPHFPGTGLEEEQGVAGNVLNIPMAPGTNAEKFLERYAEGLDKAAAFDPELVMVSCGFDAFKDDPLGGLGLDPEHFGTLTRMLMERIPANVPVVSALEGGYVLSALGPCTEAHLRILLDGE